MFPRKNRLSSEEVRLGVEEGQARVRYQSATEGSFRSSLRTVGNRGLRNLKHLYSVSLVIGSWLLEAKVGVIILTFSVCR